MENLIGKKINALTVQEKVSKDFLIKNHIRSDKRWKCLSDYGKIFYCSTYDLKSGHVTGRTRHHSKIKDLTGKRFGRLVVASRAADHIIPTSGKRDIMWNCICDCGNHCVVRGTNLRSGDSKSCGCTRSITNLKRGIIDLTGLKFGRWTVLFYAGRRLEPRGRYTTLWHCRCDCGNEKIITGSSLRNGLSLSCGCLKLEKLRQKSKKGSIVSKAEKVVFNYLLRNKILFQYQVYFKGLVGKQNYPLSYDFKVLINGHKYLIECQGIQHSRPVNYFGGKNQFKVQLHNDHLKYDFAIENGYCLIYLPYTLDDSEIKSIVSGYLI